MKNKFIEKLLILLYWTLHITLTLVLTFGLMELTRHIPIVKEVVMIFQMLICFGVGATFIVSIFLISRGISQESPVVSKLIFSHTTTKQKILSLLRFLFLCSSKSFIKSRFTYLTGVVILATVIMFAHSQFSMAIAGQVEEDAQRRLFELSENTVDLDSINTDNWYHYYRFQGKDGKQFNTASPKKRALLRKLNSYCLDDSGLFHEDKTGSLIESCEECEKLPRAFMRWKPEHSVMK